MKENIKDTSLNSDVDSESVNLKNNSKDGLDNFILNGRSNFLKLQKELYSNTTLLEKLFGVKYQNRLGYDNDKQIKTSIRITESDLELIALLKSMAKK